MDPNTFGNLSSYHTDWRIEEYQRNESYKFEAFFSRLRRHLSRFCNFLINHNLLFITFQASFWCVQRHSDDGLIFGELFSYWVSEQARKMPRWLFCDRWMLIEWLWVETKAGSWRLRVVFWLRGGFWKKSFKGTFTLLHEI